MFPSARTAWVLPGGWEAATASTLVVTFGNISAVETWEEKHADISYGGGYDGNVLTPQLGYMYNQMLDFVPDTFNSAIRRLALQQGNDYEDFFLHFSSDTTFSVANPSQSTLTPFFGLPWVVGYTADLMHAGYWLYQSRPFGNVSAWAGAALGGGLYIYSPEKLDAFILTLGQGTSNGLLQVQYPSEVDSTTFLVTAWSTLQLLTDGTSNLQQTGEVTFAPPLHWKRANTHDKSGLSYGHGAFFSQVLLRDQLAPSFVLRIMWINFTAPTLYPLLVDVRVRRYITDLNAPPPGSVFFQPTIPGWDPRNDVNSDGYVDANERNALINPIATARFRYESRTANLGQMWNSQSAWCRINVWNNALGAIMGQVWTSVWNTSNLVGAYNDDLFKLVGPTEYTLLTGGNILEYNQPINSTTIMAPFEIAFGNILATIGLYSGSTWLSANIGAINLFMSPSSRPYATTLNGFLREAYLNAGMGLTGHFGLQKAWDLFALAKLGKKNIVQGQLFSGRVANLNRGDKGNWEMDLASLLVQFYLLQTPDITYFNAWGNGFNYGSTNTRCCGNYWESGVPMNMAYQPTALLKVDIGVPANSFPVGSEPLQYMIATAVPISDYTIVGNSSSLFLVHPEVAASGILPVIPSFIYYAQQCPTHAQIPGSKYACVLARRYTKGVVFYNTDTYGNNLNFLLTNATATLPLGIFQRVFYNGSISTQLYTDSVTIQGYEGAIYVDAHLPLNNFQFVNTTSVVFLFPSGLNTSTPCDASLPHDRK